MRAVIILLALLLIVPVVLLLITWTLKQDVRRRASGDPAHAHAFFAGMESAMIRYQDVYHRKPVSPHEDLPSIRTTVAILRGVNSEYNTLGIDFLASLQEPIWRTRYDPWGEPYRLLVDMEGSGTISIGDREIKADHVIWSIGPNGVDEAGKGDDLTSWEDSP